MTLLDYNLKYINECTENDRSKITEIIEKVLEENAESSFSRQLLLDQQYRQFQRAIKTAIDHPDKVKFFDKCHERDPVICGKALKIGNIFYVFFKRNESLNANAFIDTEDNEDIIYCPFLSTNNITKKDLLEIYDGYENTIKHELTHLQDKHKYKGNRAKMVPEKLDYLKKTYNNPIEYNGYFQSFLSNAKKFVEENKSTKTKEELLNIILKEIVLIRKGSTNSTDILKLTESIKEFIRNIDLQYYNSFLKRLGEFVYYTYEKQ